MKFKKIILAMLLLIALLTIGAVSAADNNATNDIVNTNNDFNEKLEIEKINETDLNENELLYQNSLKSNNNEEILNIESDNKSNILTQQINHDSLKEYDDEDDDEDYDEEEIEPAKIKITPTKVNYKAKKYITIKITNKNGHPIEGEVEIGILKGKTVIKWFDKYYNSKPIKISTKNLKPGKYEVYVNFYDDIYEGAKSQKLTVKKTNTKKKTTTKKTTTKKKTSYTKFKSPSGYKWKIKTSTWNKMKKQAKKNYKFFKSVGSSLPGYSDKSVNVKVTKNGHTYKGFAFAKINSKYPMHCEVRGIKNGLRITDKYEYWV